MLLPKHWSLQYAYDRLRYVAYRWTHPYTPWFTPAAIDFLEKHLSASDEGFEWGSGWSTLWFARRLASIASVEHDPEWRERVSRQLLRNSLYSAVIFLEQDEDSYVRAIERMPQRNFSLIVVDGLDKLRDRCALLALDHIKPGGLILVDDVQRYLPSNSRSPNAVLANSPPRTPLWQEFVDRVRTWNVVWTSSGVTDTAIWRSPETH